MLFHFSNIDFNKPSIENSQIILLIINWIILDKYLLISFYGRGKMIFIASIDPILNIIFLFNAQQYSIYHNNIFFISFIWFDTNQYYSSSII